MKLWLLLIGGATLLFAWLALRGPADAPTAPAIVKATTVAPQEAARPELPPTAELQPRGIRVHGVLFRGERDPQSQALLSVEGQPAHPFRIGEAVAQGWALEKVAPDHVVLTLGGARARLDVSYSVRASETPAAQTVPVSMPGPAVEAAPGLRPAPAGAAPPQPPSVTGNRAFMEARQKREAGAPPQR
jgi:general secretion pathway protein C